MPMMLALALLAPAAALPADPREAALTCGAAVRALPDSLSLANSAVGMWFGTKAAALMSTDATLLDNIGPNMQELMKRVDAARPNRDALIAECRQRFPLAWKTSGVVLPADDYERRVTCAFDTIALSALAKSQEGGKYFDRIDGLARRFLGQIDDAEMEKRSGPRSPQEEAARVLTAGLELGNLQGIVTACETAYPG